MAISYAISAVSKTIRGILVNACPVADFPGAEFKILQASDFRNAPPLTEGVSIYLYRVLVNGPLRNNPPRVTADGKRYSPPLPVDLYYLLSFWGADFDKQQRLLGWAMRTLNDYGHLPISLLNSFGPEPETFRADETVDLTYDMLSMQDMLNINDSLKPNVTLSAGYMARTIVLEIPRELVVAPLAQTREFGVGTLVET